jgi:hypothetical protein
VVLFVRSQGGVQLHGSSGDDDHLALLAGKAAILVQGLWAFLEAIQVVTRSSDNRREAVLDDSVRKSTLGRRSLVHDPGG